MAYNITMCKAISVVLLMVMLAVIVNAYALDKQLNTKIRVRRGFSNSGFGGSGGDVRGYGRGSDQQDASVSRETLGGCSGENGRSGSREVAFNRDGRSSNDNHRGGRAFSKSSATASAIASAFNQKQKAAVDA